MNHASHAPLPPPPSAADPELEFAIVVALYEPQRLMIPLLLRIRHQPRADFVKGVHITGAPYSTRQVMKGNCFGAISFDKVHVAAADVMSAFVSVDAAAPPSSRFILAKGTPLQILQSSTVHQTSINAAKGDTRAVYHVRLLNRLIVGRVLFPAAGMVPTPIIPSIMHASIALPLNHTEQAPLLNNVQVFLMRGISAVTHPDLVKEKLDRPWIRSVLAQALREHDGMRRWLEVLFQTKHHFSKLFSQAAQSRYLRHGQMGSHRGLLFPSPPFQRKPSTRCCFHQSRFLPPRV
jgi:hypothetical protein